jgi:hypothetical protein
MRNGATEALAKFKYGRTSLTLPVTNTFGSFPKALIEDVGFAPTT